MSDLYHARLVGGQNLTKTRPLFSQNSEKLFIPHDNLVLGFLIRNGKLNQIISLNEKHASFKEEHAAICLHPISPDFQLFSFTRAGSVFSWNYDDSSLIKEYDLGLISLLDRDCELVWATAKNYYYDASNHLVVYFVVRYLADNGKPHFKLYATPLDDLSFKQELIDLKVFDLKRIAFGRNQDYLILIDKNEIYFVGLRNGFKRDESAQAKPINSKKRFLFKDKLKIVCCNPLKDQIAYTCKDGVIRLITINKDGKLVGDTKARLHWHSMPITDMCFSSNGVYLYSVGYETVTVRWNLESFAKNFVSNAGYSIKYVSCDQSNSSVALTLHNNEIRLITSYFDGISKSLNNLNYYDNKRIETGLVFDPKHDALVLNGRPGHIQFYSPLAEENVLLLDVATTRFILNNEKDSKFEGSRAVNIEVFRVAISECGNWLATYEMKDDKTADLEARLKFWKYLKGCNPMQMSGLRLNEDYEVQTCINLPHKTAINEMKFSNDTDYLVTTSQDGSFKIWVNNRDNYDWYCLFTYTFQESLVPNHVSVSFDSSMFAINYGSLNTIWKAKDLTDVKYIDTLKQPDSRLDKASYIALEFGAGMMSHLLAGCTMHSLTVWNVSKAEVKWNYLLPKDLHFKRMAYNSSANNLVLINSAGHLDVFSINSTDGQPLFSFKSDVSITKQISFLLMINQSNYRFKQPDDLFGDQMVCFMTHQKQLYVLEHRQSKEEREKFKLKENIIETTPNSKAISSFVQELIDRKANQLKQGNYNVSKSLDSVGLGAERCNLNKLVDDMFYNVPSHVLPPIQMIAKPFLRSLLNVENARVESDQATPKTQKPISYNLDEEDMENSENEESDRNRTKANAEDEPNEPNELFKNERLVKSFFFREDYSFLSK